METLNRETGRREKSQQRGPERVRGGQGPPKSREARETQRRAGTPEEQGRPERVRGRQGP